MKRTRIISPVVTTSTPARSWSRSAACVASPISSRTSVAPRRPASIASRASHTHLGRPWLPTTEVGSSITSLLCRLCGSARAGLARPDRRHRPPVLVGREAAGEEGLHLFPERLEVDVEGTRREHLAGASARGRQRQETLERRLERAGELRGLHDAVHDAVALGRARRNGLAEQDQLLGARETDEARQAPERHGRDQALLHRREPEERLIRREAVVADERELEPTTQAVAVDPRDEELVHSLHRRHRVLPRDEVGHTELPVGERGEVHARRERTAGARQRDHADLGPLGERRDRGLEVGLVAGAFGFARMAADIPIGLFLTHHLRRAVVVGPCVLAVGVLVLTSGGTFPVPVLGRLLMGVGHALGMVGGLTAILRYRTGWSLASALNAYEFSAMIGILCGTVLVGALPSSLSWNRALLVTCAPQLLGILTLPALLRALSRSDAPGPRPLFARQAAPGPDAPGAPITPALVLAFVAGGAIAVAYSTVEQFSIPLRGSRELGLERAGVARLLVVMQVFDIAALLPLGVLADRRGTVPVLVAVLLVMAAASALVGFGTLPVVAAGCALYGLGMAGWMLPLGVLRRETPQEHVAWRTGLYRVCVDGGIFLGPFLAGLLGAGHARILTGVWAAALALTGLLFLLRERRRP